MGGDPEHRIVIENQYNKTDHDHLGKLLTHAAMHKAMTGIWIAEVVSDDHRQAIDWVNENTPPNVNLYLAVLKAHKIDNSNPAPFLDVVCRPNNLVKAKKKSAVKGEPEGSWYYQTWTSIMDIITKSKHPFKLQSPSDQNWTNVSVGKSDFHLAMVLNPQKKKIRTELYIDCDWAKSAFAQLYEQKEEIESRVGAVLDWQELPDKKASRIALETDIDPADPCYVAEASKLFDEQLSKFYEAFKPRVAKLKEPYDAD